jgi:hypothetical protein
MNRNDEYVIFNVTINHTDCDSILYIEQTEISSKDE